MPLLIRDLQDKIQLEDKLLSQLELITQEMLKEEKLSHDIEVSLCFVDNHYIRELNKQYRGKDQATDVLSFPLEEDKGEEFFQEPEVLLGDIVISLEEAKAQADEAGHSINKEIALLYIHGFLHLLSYHHSSEEEYEQMWNKMGKIMEIIGYQGYNIK
ncbi:rRNA maturation RNase YbeY [Candidatus Contubernalis alkaliaceticus]|uniref:rRNA maturation RNase YbeY n=1 Tax=Candidatus Contubernalis alkaliaceticus TaxID=338645 RepID=UPI001F4C461C|nr:rRNA maturation RNase YbeY [Candidatus Contubernalis alkalaceticus]UNC93128.1 rRNA maturation RNase YbeY [Candidatus Contubernalis alkalaceticus]